ncbi:MAG: insulinase family protein, partial [Bacteroidota bacterium]
ISDVQKAAIKYFAPGNLRVVVVGKGSEVLDNLEKVSLEGKTVPVFYYDKNGIKTERPDYSSQIPEGLTAKDVINSYIDALGGREKLEAVQSYVILAEAEMQGMKLNLELKKTSKNQSMQNLMVMGNSMSKQVFNGDSGYMMMQGQRKELTTEEVEKAMQESIPFPELHYMLDSIQLEGIEAVDGKKAYKLKMSDERVLFFNMESGLKVQEMNTLEMQGQQMQQTTTYGDYQEVAGIKFPFMFIQSMGPQQVEFNVKEVRLNEGVTDADFE